jgi:hypothetical protein
MVIFLQEECHAYSKSGNSISTAVNPLPIPQLYPARLIIYHPSPYYLSFRPQIKPSSQAPTDSAIRVLCSLGVALKHASDAYLYCYLTLQCFNPNIKQLQQKWCPILSKWNSFFTTPFFLYMHNTLPVLSYCSKSWTVKTKDQTQIQATEIKFLRPV